VPALTVDPTGILRSAETALAGSQAAVRRAQLAVRRAQLATSRARQLRDSCRRRRPDRYERTCRFRLVGIVDGKVVSGRFDRSGLRCSGDLYARAELVVGLGDSFGDRDGGLVSASLEGTPIQALLTLTRACDQVLELTMALGAGEHGPSGGPHLEVRAETIHDVDADFEEARRRVQSDHYQWRRLDRGD